MSEQLVYYIAGENYILVEEFLSDSSNKRKIKSKCEKFDCIYQGIKEVKIGWVSGHAIVKILVPERNIIKYNNHE